MKITISKHFQDLIYPLTTEERAVLEISILKHGVKDPLVIWQNGRNYLLDGHHRWEIIKKHNISKYKVLKLQFEDKKDAINWVLENQLGRRNCSPEGISYLRGLRYKNEKLLPHRPKKGEKVSPLKTSERLAQQYKITARTIYNDEKFADAIDSILSAFHPKETAQIKTKLLSREIGITKKDIVELSALPSKQIRDVISGKKKFWEARAEDNRIKKNRRLKRAAQLSLPKDIKLYVGDCVDLSRKHLKNNSVGCIISDPPFSKDALECFDKLGRIAKRVLKPSGFCCFYTGKLHLDSVFGIMGKHLKYYWQIILLHHGKIGTDFNPYSIDARKVNTFYKSILIFQKPPFKRTAEYFDDVIKGSGIEKNIHIWQQSERELHRIVEKFSDIGSLVLDPFNGGGTTGVVCNKLGRKYIGFDSDSDCINETRIRIRNIANAIS